MQGTDVVIIGAGLCGLTAAQRLAADGLGATVLEKARGPGGRMSTRRDGSARFDHGAQYFTVRSTAFRQQVERWQSAGLVARWSGPIGVCDGRQWSESGEDTERFVGVPGMSAPSSELARGLDCRFGRRAVGLERSARGWRADLDDGTELEARACLITAPPEQAAELVAGVDERLAREARSIAMTPCWAVMARLDGNPLPWDGAFVNAGPLAWIARNSSKPRRPGSAQWVLHGTPEWSTRHLEREPEAVAEELVDALRALPGIDRLEVLEAEAHRWRYAQARNPLETGWLAGSSPGLCLAGDWCAGNRVEGAWLSGRAAAAHLIDYLGAG